MHSVWEDAAYCYQCQCSVSVCFGLVSPVKTDEPVEMPFGRELGWGGGGPKNRGRCTLTPPGEYDE